MREDILEISSRDIDKRKRRMRLLDRARFVLFDSDGLKQLCLKLASYNDALLKISSLPIEEVHPPLSSLLLHMKY